MLKVQPQGYENAASQSEKILCLKSAGEQLKAFAKTSCSVGELPESAAGFCFLTVRQNQSKKELCKTCI